MIIYKNVGSENMKTRFVLGAIIAITVTMYVYALDPSVLLKHVVVEAQENTTTGNNEIEIGNNLTLTNPFYEGTSAKLLSQTVLDTTSNGLPQIELTTVQDATIEGVGNVTNLGTWAITYKTTHITYATGKGVITADNGDMITWTASDVGRADDKGVISYRGLIFFDTTNSSSSATSGKLSLLDNREALFVTHVNVTSIHRDQSTKMWEWN